MNEGLKPDEDAVPRYGRGVRLQHDKTRDIWMLLAPERMLELDSIAYQVISRIDGERSIAAIVDDLAGVFAADRNVILDDVRALIADLAAKRLVLT